MAFQDNHYYHSSIRRLTAAVGSLFKNMRIERLNADGTLNKSIIVPLSYVSGDRGIVMRQQQQMPRERRDIEIRTSLPRMSFGLTGITYDSIRVTQPLINTIYNNTVNGVATTQYKPIPYDIEYTINIWVKNIDDGLQLIEQIIPYFRPFYTITLEQIPSLNIKNDVQLSLVSISHEDVFEGVIEDERILNWTMILLAKSWIYPPISSSKVIKIAHTNLFDFETDEKLFGTIIQVDPLSAEKDDAWTIREIRN